MELRAVSLMMCVSISLCSPLLPPRLLLDIWPPRFGQVGWFPRISSFATICENKRLKRALCLCGGNGRAVGTRLLESIQRDTTVALTAGRNRSKMLGSLPGSRKSGLETPIRGKPGLFLLPMKHVFKVTTI